MNYKNLFFMTLIAGFNAFTMEMPERQSNLINPAEHAALFIALAQEAQAILNHKDEKSIPNIANDQNENLKCNRLGCNVAFTYKSQLVSHVRRHTYENRFKCNQCNYSCSFNSDLAKHNRIHTGEKPYQCDQCSFSSAQTSNVSRHKRVAHNAGKEPEHSEGLIWTAEIFQKKIG